MNEEQFQHFVEQYKAEIETLIRYGAFEYPNSTVYMNFDQDGTLKTIKIDRKIYQRSKDA